MHVLGSFVSVSVLCPSLILGSRNDIRVMESNTVLRMEMLKILFLMYFTLSSAHVCAPSLSLLNML